MRVVTLQTHPSQEVQNKGSTYFPPHSPHSVPRKLFLLQREMIGVLKRASVRAELLLCLSVTSQINQDSLWSSHGTDTSSCPQLIQFCSCAKLLVSGHTTQQSPVLLGHGSRGLSTPVPPQLPLPGIRMAGEVAMEEQRLLPSSKNPSQSFNVTRKDPNRSSLPFALCLSSRAPIMGCLRVGDEGEVL